MAELSARGRSHSLVMIGYGRTCGRRTPKPSRIAELALPSVGWGRRTNQVVDGPTRGPARERRVEKDGQRRRDVGDMDRLGRASGGDIPAVPYQRRTGVVAVRRAMHRRDAAAEVRDPVRLHPGDDVAGAARVETALQLRAVPVAERAEAQGRAGNGAGDAVLLQ